MWSLDWLHFTGSLLLLSFTVAHRPSLFISSPVSLLASRLLSPLPPHPVTGKMDKLISPHCLSFLSYYSVLSSSSFFLRISNLFGPGLWFTTDRYFHLFLLPVSPKVNLFFKHWPFPISLFCHPICTPRIYYVYFFLFHFILSSCLCALPLVHLLTLTLPTLVLSLPPPPPFFFTLGATPALLPLSSHADTSSPQPPTPQIVKLPPPVLVTNRMAMPVLIRACMARCSARLSRGLWEREMLILASGDGLKTTGAKTSKHFVIMLAHWTHPHMRTWTQVSMRQQFCSRRKQMHAKITA